MQQIVAVDENGHVTLCNGRQRSTDHEILDAIEFGPQDLELRSRVDGIDSNVPRWAGCLFFRSSFFDPVGVGGGSHSLIARAGGGSGIRHPVYSIVPGGRWTS